MTNALIREIEESDFSKLLELLKEFATFQKTPEQMKNNASRMQAEKEFINGLVIVSGEEIIGYVTYNFVYYTWSGKSLYMDDLYIKPQHRGSGLGARLINAVIDYGRRENCHKLKWQVSDWNKPAIEFYLSLGAEIDSTESNCELALVSS